MPSPLRAIAPLLATAALATPAVVGAAETVPDPGATRKHIEQLAAGFLAAHRAATLGLLHDAVQESIGYGAPAYNAGDHRGCAEFYAATGAALVAGFSGTDAVSALAAPGLVDLRDACQRFRTIDDLEHGAWTMRLAFDQVSLAWTMALQHGVQLGKLGSEYFHRGDYDEATLAFVQAERLLDEVRGEHAADVAVELRMVPLLHGQALLEQQRFPAAAAAFTAHLDEVRELMGVDIDLRALYGNPDEFELTMLALDHAAEGAPASANLHFLLGLELHFSGRRREAREQFTKAAAIEPAHAGAALFLAGDQQTTVP